MTKKELIECLNDPHKQIPDEAIIMTFDSDAGKAMPITGMLYGGRDNTVELCTDDMQD